MNARQHTLTEVLRPAIVLLLASFAILHFQAAYAISPPKHDTSKTIGRRKPQPNPTLLATGADLLNELGQRVKQVPPTDKEMESVVRIVKEPLVSFGDRALKSVRTRLEPERKQSSCCSGPQTSAEALADTAWMPVLWTIVAFLGVAFALLYGILVAR
jgi:hypothetical protein